MKTQHSQKKKKKKGVNPNRNYDFGSRLIDCNKYPLVVGQDVNDDEGCAGVGPGGMWKFSVLYVLL